MHVRCSLTLVPALLLAVGLTGCGTVDQGDLRAAGTPAGTAADTSTDTSDHPAAAAATADHSPADVVSWPQDVTDPQDGGSYVVVYLGPDPDAGEAVERYGYHASVTTASCLQGIEGAWHLSSILPVTHLVFADRAAADQFVSSYESAEPDAFAAAVPVTGYCHDEGDPQDQEVTLPASVEEPVQGGSYGLVVLAAGRPAALRASQREIREVTHFGDAAYVGEVGCYQGAAEALGLADGTLVSAMMFDDLATAQEFVDTYGYYVDTPVVGVAAVTAYCLD
ncbi:hypothetical protein [Nocardioides rubriscoriae]|uniref:hypothetical protein n=1 Tax=Nocardioides rubriscoriae TaxID=642762 RepID=UPI0011DFB54B|nr:hypothetical protein [Nocardioides rubriscoriae]